MLLKCPKFSGNSRQRKMARRTWHRNNVDALRTQEEEIGRAICWINEGDDSFELDHESRGGILEMAPPKQSFFGFRTMTMEELKGRLIAYGVSPRRFTERDRDPSPNHLLNPPQ